MSHYEIIHTDDGHTVRLVSNGHTLLSSGGQVYARRVGAERAALAAARAHGVPALTLEWNVPSIEKVMIDGSGGVAENSLLVRYIDQRSGR